MPELVPSSSFSPRHFNFDELVERACDDKDLALEILSDFSVQAQQFPLAIGAAAADSPTQVAREVHRLRGALLAVGAAEAAALTSDCEIALLSDDAEIRSRGKQLVDAVLDSLRTVTTEIDIFVKNVNNVVGGLQVGSSGAARAVCAVTVVCTDEEPDAR